VTGTPANEEAVKRRMKVIYPQYLSPPTIQWYLKHFFLCNEKMHTLLPILFFLKNEKNTPK
jgi:hypothetical protein